MSQVGALADNLAELPLPANFVLKIEPLSSEPFSRFFHLVVMQGIFDRDSDLVANLAEQIDVLLRKGILPQTDEAQNAENTIATDKRERTTRLQTLLGQKVLDLRIQSCGY